MKSKERIITILICAIVTTIMSAISAYAAASYLYNADEVSYDKTNSELTSTNVQGAIDELYTKATEYTALTNRVSTLEGHFKNSPTSAISEYGIELNNLTGSSGTTTGGYIDFHYGGSSADYTSRINESANGRLSITATNGVQINGTLFESMFETNIVSVDNINVTASNIASGSASVAKTGYKPLLVTCSIYNATSGGGNSSNSNAYICELSGATVNYIIKNYATTAAKLKLNIQVLYVKNSDT